MQRSSFVTQICLGTEEGASMPLPGALFGACGILCAASVGLLNGGTFGHRCTELHSHTLWS